MHLTFDAADNVAAPYLNLAKPKVAILREQGVNSHVEMAYAFTEAGFEAFDVHMTDLQTGRVKLEDFRAWSPAGLQLWRHAGRGHRLGAFHHLQPRAGSAVPGLLWPHGHVWPGRVQRLPDVCRAGRHHPRRAGLAALHHQPERALRGPPVAGGSAGIPSLFLQGMAGSRLPIAVAHGEGYANFKYRGNADKAIAAMRYVDNHGRATGSTRSTPTAAPVA